MTFNDLKYLAAQGVILQISAADLLEVVQHTNREQKVPQKPIKPLNMRQASEFYGYDRKTITKYIKDGNIKGMKRGARWEIYPQAE